MPNLDKIAAALLCVALYLVSPARAEHETEPAQVSAARHPAAIDRRPVTILIGGDLGLNGSDQPVGPDGAAKHGTRYGWAELTAGIRPLLTADINFANLETVVTDRNDLPQVSKAFNFRSHPRGVRHLVEAGFNVFSTANNHAVDYGEAGVRETLKHLSALEGSGLKALPGIGIGREQAGRPARVEANGRTVRIAAIGIGGGTLAAGAANRAGMLAYHSAGDFTEIVGRLADADGDYRMLSVHYGIELSVRPAAADIRRLRDEAVRGGGIDLVAGHHAHVVAGVQEVGGRIIFYGLGNLLHPGMQDMGKFALCRDYGLVARLHLLPGEDGRLRARAVEVILLTQMHLKAEPMAPQPGRERVEVLNNLAAGLDDVTVGARGVRFAPQRDGSGLACLPGAGEEPGPIGALCRDWRPPESPPPALAARIQSCTGVETARSSRVREASGDGAGGARTQRRARMKPASGGGLFWPFGQ